jgi:hypothetical protein
LSKKLKVIALLLSVSLLSGCNETTGSGSQENTMQGNVQPANTTSVPIAKAENPPPAMGDAVRVARWSRDLNGLALQAALRGRLAIINNCLVIQNNQGTPSILLIFPYNSGVWDDAKRTFTFNGNVIGIGEFIEVGGGTPPNLDYLKQFGKYDVPDCGINNFFQVF